MKCSHKWTGRTGDRWSFRLNLQQIDTFPWASGKPVTHACITVASSVDIPKKKGGYYELSWKKTDPDLHTQTLVSNFSFKTRHDELTVPLISFLIASHWLLNSRVHRHSAVSVVWPKVILQSTKETLNFQAAIYQVGQRRGRTTVICDFRLQVMSHPPVSDWTCKILSLQVTLRLTLYGTVRWGAPEALHKHFWQGNGMERSYGCIFSNLTCWSERKREQ